MRARNLVFMVMVKIVKHSLGEQNKSYSEEVEHDENKIEWLFYKIN